MKMIYCQPCINHGLIPLIDETITLGISDYIQAACIFLNITEEEITRKNRERKRVELRQMVMTFLYIEKGFKVEEIGRHFNKDHSSVSFATKQVANLNHTNYYFRIKYQNLKNHLNSLK